MTSSRSPTTQSSHAICNGSEPFPTRTLLLGVASRSLGSVGCVNPNASSAGGGPPIAAAATASQRVPRASSESSSQQVSSAILHMARATSSRRDDGPVLASARSSNDRGSSGLSRTSQRVPATASTRRPRRLAISASERNTEIGGHSASAESRCDSRRPLHLSQTSPGGITSSSVTSPDLSEFPSVSGMTCSSELNRPSSFPQNRQPVVLFDGCVAIGRS